MKLSFKSKVWFPLELSRQTRDWHFSMGVDFFVYWNFRTYAQDDFQDPTIWLIKHFTYKEYENTGTKSRNENTLLNFIVLKDQFEIDFKSAMTTNAFSILQIKSAALSQNVRCIWIMNSTWINRFGKVPWYVFFQFE